MGQIEFEGGYVEDMESYGLGGPLGAPWEVWVCGTAQAGEISDVQAHSGVQSHLLDTLFDGSIDMTLWDATPPTTGQWELSGWYFVPANAFGSHYLIALSEYDGACNGGNNDWSLQVHMNGDLDEIVDEQSSGNAIALPRDRWFQVQVLVDLDLNLHDILINDPDGAGTTLLTDDFPWTGGLVQIQCYDHFASDAIGWFADDLVIEAPVGGGTCPDSFTLVNGIESSGAFGDACGSDDVLWTLSSTTFDAVFSPAPINVELVALNLNPGASLTFTMEGHPTFGGGTAFITVALFNYTTGLFEQSVFAGQADGPPDVVYSKTVDNSAGDYANANGDVKARITGAKTAAGPVRLNIDDMFWD